MEELNQLNIDPSNVLVRQEHRIDLPQSFSARVFHESEGDAQNIETNGLDSNAMASEEKQLRKRKRNIMNHMQVTMIEQALQNEPDMQRKAASIQIWADKLSLHVRIKLNYMHPYLFIVKVCCLINMFRISFFQGSEISASQLKNW